jgi:hypothetical protein
MNQISESEFRIYLSLLKGFGLPAAAPSAAAAAALSFLPMIGVVRLLLILTLGELVERYNASVKRIYYSITTVQY